MDNHHWPEVSPSDLLDRDLPAREHLFRHFVDDPERVNPPDSGLWRERHDRGQSFRSLRDGSLEERRLAAFRSAWGLSKVGEASEVPQVTLNLSRQDLDEEGLYVLTEFLRDGHLPDLEELRVGNSDLWHLVELDTTGGGASVYKGMVRFADAVVSHSMLHHLHFAGLDLDMRTLRGGGDDHLDLSNKGLGTAHALIIAAGLRANQMLKTLDLRFNENIGIVGLSSLAEAFLGGAATSLEQLNNIVVDKKPCLELSGRVEKYELIWVARRLEEVRNRRCVKELRLREAGIDPDAARVVSRIAASMSKDIDLLDLSGNAICGIHRDRYGAWHGEESSEGLELVLRALRGHRVAVLKLNGCALGTSGPPVVAAALSGGSVMVRAVELRLCNLEEAGIAALLAVLGVASGPEVVGTCSDGGDTTAYVDEGALASRVSGGLSVFSGTKGSASATTAGLSDLDWPCPTVESLDTRGNPMSRTAEARLAVLIEGVFAAGVLESLNGIDFRPHKLLRCAPTTNVEGEEWWHQGRSSVRAKEEAVTHHSHPNVNVSMVVSSGRTLVVSKAEESAAGPSFPPPAPLSPAAAMVSTGRGGILYTSQPTALAPSATLDVKAAWGSLPHESSGGGNTKQRTQRALPAAFASQEAGGVGELGSGLDRLGGRGLAIHETVFCCRQALRLRLTKLLLVDVQLVGLAKSGAGVLGMGEVDRHMSLEPLRAVCSLVRDSGYLNYLDLSGNALGNTEGAVELVSQALSMSMALRSLSLKRNCIGEAIGF